MISQTAEYALRAVVFLADNHDTSTSRQDMANEIRVPNDYLTKVLRELERAGIVSSQRGPGGGYRLAVPPEETSLYDVVTVVWSLPRIEKCPLGIEGHVKLCPLHKRLDEASALVERAFRETMVSDLLPARSAPLTCRFPCS